MKLYPIATEDALKVLEKGDKEGALEILNVSLNTIVSETVLIPLSLLVAEDLVVTASVLDKENKEDALALLSLAQDELKKAVYLGYTKRHSIAYKALEEEIEAVKKEIKGKNIVEKLYDKVKESFKSLVGENRKELKSENNSSK
jgi:translation initiation factor IF-2